MDQETKSFLKFIIFQAKAQSKLLFLGLSFALLSSALTGFGTWSAKPIFNFVFEEKNYAYFKFVPVYIFLLFSLIGFFSLLQAYFMKALSIKVVNSLRLKLFKKCLYLPYSSITKERSGQTVSRVINDTSQIEPVLGESFQIIFKEAFTVLVLISVAFYQKWDLTLLILVTLPAIVWGTKYLGTKARRARSLTQRATGELTHRTGEVLQGIREIKLVPSKEILIKLFSKELERFYVLSLKVTKYKESSKSLVDLMTGLGGALIVGYGGFLIMKGSISPGALLSLITAMLLIFNPLRKLARAYTGLKEAQGAWMRIEEVLKIEEELGGNFKAFPPREGIYLKEVSFRYGQDLPLVLERISLFIPAGRIIALVGPSGAGKSTLISLLPRFYDPTEGEIFLDNQPIKDFDLESLRGLYGMVWQEPFLFNLSLWDNLTLVKPEANDEEVREACRLAQALEFIESLPQGFETVLGEEGFTLSGGQKQRLALARVFLKRPPIIILDEATSQLDTLTERAIENALQNLRGKHTLIVIAHRLSTVVQADKIVVMDKGKIVAEGNHQELLTKSPLYRSLYQTFQRREG
ncbi:MAG: ABC transporter ATP-binding protein/permease [Caldimicrobium sp.]|nr:ABC transporter ATP-binding protein/permease [Caldimicrobium sp.]MCX7873670.1 ABC transporter ATP-binding protein/permease [Caldimicrobium sp.]MDW8094636.1 ABC transporter ATP-binding protein [Caldimicrobium sp.]